MYEQVATYSVSGQDLDGFTEGSGSKCEKKGLYLSKSWKLWNQEIAFPEYAVLFLHFERV